MKRYTNKISDEKIIQTTYQMKRLQQTKYHMKILQQAKI